MSFTSSDEKKKRLLEPTSFTNKIYFKVKYQVRVDVYCYR